MVSVVRDGPMVVAIVAAESYREARVGILEIITNMTVAPAVEFFGLFVTSVGEVSAGISLSVVLENCNEGFVSCSLVVAHFVILTVNGHPGDRQVFLGIGTVTR